MSSDLKVILDKVIEEDYKRKESDGLFSLILKVVFFSRLRRFPSR